MGTERRFIEQLKKLRGSATVIIGIGNTLKGDDGVGPLICRKLAQAEICAEIMDTGTVPENYIQPIINKAPQNLVIIDAIDFAGPPGSVKIFKPNQLSSLAISTHTLSPHLFVDMIQHEIDVDVYFIGIQPAQTQLGQPLSSPIGEVVELLSNTLAEIFSRKNNIH